MPKTITFDRWEQGIDRRKGSSVTDANRLIELDNCFVTSGWGLQKRPGASLVASLKPGTKGLFGFGGKLHTFSSVAVDHSNQLMQNNVISVSGQNSAVSKIHFADVFNNAIYVAAEYANGITKHHYISGSAPYEVTDSDCPHSKAVVKIASKLWAVDGDVVRYCAVNAPSDWSASQDAGFLPTGLQAGGDNEALSVGEYGGRLAVFMKDSTQVWIVDPDPVVNALESNIANVGSEYPASIKTVGGNLYFLSNVGFRSVSQQSFSSNYVDLDIGTQIDSLVVSELGADNVSSVYYPGAGQYWCAVGSKVFVFTFSRTSKINAWSVYTYPFTVDAWAVLGAKLYIRSGDSVYLVDEGAYTDAGESINVNILTGHQSFKRPGRLKQVMGMDVVTQGSANVSFLWDARNPALETTPFTVSGDTRPGPMNPVEVTATEIATRIAHNDDSFFRLDSMSFIYNELNSQ